MNVCIKHNPDKIEVIIKPNLPVGRIGLWLNIPEEGVTLSGERKIN